MSDTTDTTGGAAAEQAEVTPTAETTAADSQPEEQTATGAEGDKPAETKKEDSPAQETVQQTDSKPKSRRSAEFRIGQLTAQRDTKAKEADQWKAKYEEAVGSKDEGDPQTEDSPDISKQVLAEVDRRMEPVLKQHTSAADDAEIGELFTGNPEKRALYEPRIRDAWKLDQYKDLAASDLMKLFSYDQDVAAAKAAGVEEWKKAQKEAKESSGSGTSARKDASQQKDAWELSEADFKAQQDKVRQMG